MAMDMYNNYLGIIVHPKQIEPRHLDETNSKKNYCSQMGHVYTKFPWEEKIVWTLPPSKYLSGTSLHWRNLVQQQFCCVAFSLEPLSLWMQLGLSAAYLRGLTPPGHRFIRIFILLLFFFRLCSRFWCPNHGGGQTCLSTPYLRVFDYAHLRPFDPIFTKVPGAVWLSLNRQTCLSTPYLRLFDYAHLWPFDPTITKVARVLFDYHSIVKPA
jgi:hypothetical protein